jgi:ribose transport system substrate-binding protein
MGRTSRSSRSALPGALAIACVLTVAACASSSSSTGAASSSSSKPASSSAASSCGTIPTIAYDDQSGLVSSLGSYAAQYNGFQGTIYKSTWSSWPGKTGAVKVGILIDGLANGYQTQLESSLTSDLKADGYSTVTDVPAATVTAQLQGYQSLLNDGVNMIIAQAQSPTAYDTLIDKAAKEGVPTIGVLNDIVDQNAVNVVPNSVLGGMDLAQFVVKKADSKGLVLFLHGIPGVPIDTATADGANDVLKLCPQITTNESIVTQFQPSIAKQQMLSFLSTHTQAVSGVITAGPFTSGVIQAFLQAGKTVPPITNNGLDEGGLAYWMQHESTFPGVALANTPNGLAYATVEVAQKMLEGDGVKINTLSIAPPVVTTSNLSTYVTLNSSWTINSAGSASGPANLYVSSAYIDAIFSK